MKHLIIALALGAFLASPARAQKPTAEQLAAFFDTVVFGAEYLKSGSKVIQKWTGPVRIQVAAMGGKMIDKGDGKRELKLNKRVPDRTHVDVIRKHLKTLLKISKVKVENAKKLGKQPNFFIKFVPRIAMHAPFLVPGADPKLLKKMAQAGVCYFLTAAKGGRIVWATIVVNIELPLRDIDSCLLEEMTQTLGLPNDSDLVKPSVFNNRSQPTALNRTDVILLRALYDPRLHPGMAREPAMKVARQVIGELDAKLK
ncbi:MAG: DUF2927 domain-containing protein [Magnetovibrio sp.]|nr:DUF2927 domain-containing protein [Magnetovibrio sp.]